MQSYAGPLSCEYCGEVFQRREHRDRHLLRHSGARPFRCDACPKTFPRRDSLVRHWATHRSSAEPPGYPRRAPQACIRCARLKQRCEGGNPCPRCMRQKSRCEYQRARAPSDTGVLVPSPVAAGDTVGVGMAHDSSSRISDMNTAIISPPDNSALPSLWDQSSVAAAHATTPPGMGWGIDGWSATSTLFSDLGVHEPSILDFAEPRSTGFPFLPITADPGVLPWHEVSRVTHDQVRSRDPFHEPAYGSPNTQSQAKARSERSARPASDPRVLSCARCPEFPEVSRDDLLTAQAELFGHLAAIPAGAVEGIQAFYNQQRKCDSSRFVEADVLHAFVELYLEYFDPKFPFLHNSRVKSTNLPWILLVAIAAVGSEYSGISSARDHGSVLQELLCRAIEAHTLPRPVWANTTIIQSLFLRHVLLFFSSDRSKHIAHEFEKNKLVSALYASTATDEPSPEEDNEADRGLHGDWQTWVSTEESIRLFYCVHALECLVFVFLDQPPLFNLSDFVQELPCDDSPWKCQTAEEWRRNFVEGSDQSLCDLGEEPQLVAYAPQSQLGAFTQRMHVLELYVDDRLQARQARSSKILRTVFGHQRTPAVQRGDLSSKSTVPTSPSYSPATKPLVDEVIDADAYAQIETRRQQQDMVVHVLAILRRIPLTTLYRATGWQTDEDGKAASGLRLGRFLHRDDTAARKCLWHAATIFMELRNVRHFACYDAFSLCVAVCYIWSYAHLGPEARRPASQSVDANPSLPQRATLRLDGLPRRRDVERWIMTGGDTDIHVTGIGLLSGSNSRFLLLTEAIRILTNQPAWSGFCRGLAMTFVQLRRGELPNHDKE